MYYVYIIQSVNYPDKRYVGITQNMQQRLANHNIGTTSHSRKYKPWEFVMCLCFKNKDYKFHKIESAIIKVFSNKINKLDMNKIVKARKLRNTLFHLDFFELTNLGIDLKGREIKNGKQIALKEDSNIIEGLLSMDVGGFGKVRELIAEGINVLEHIYRLEPDK